MFTKIVKARLLPDSNPHWRTSLFPRTCLHPPEGETLRNWPYSPHTLRQVAIKALINASPLLNTTSQESDRTVGRRGDNSEISWPCAYYLRLMTVAAAVGLLMKQEPGQPVWLIFFIQWKPLENPQGHQPNLFILCFSSNFPPIMWHFFESVNVTKKRTHNYIVF